jgi:hypothetical protein
VLLRIDTLPLLRCRRLGLAGSAVLVLGGIFAGVPPMRDPLLREPMFEAVRRFTTPAVMCVFVGVSLLLLAWWRLGRLLRERDAPDLRDLLTTLVWWAAPLMVTIPIFSRDVYSYLAQGKMTDLGIDAYQYGPAILGGPLSENIPQIWQTTPAPYGPVFLSLASDVTTMTGESIWTGIFGMRILALGGMALIVWSVPRIARAAGVDPRNALWLGVLNPLVLIHLVADAHNDSLMLGLMLAGLAFALERRPAAGAVLVAFGALVKAPAALALLFIVPIWVGQMSGSARWLRAGLGSFGIVALTAVATTTVAGTGYGWISALDTPTRAHTWTSVTTDVGYWAGLLTDRLGIATADQALAACRLIGLAAAGLSCLYLFQRHYRLRPVVGLGLGLAVVLALGPVVHPWYLLWAIIPLAAAADSPKVRRGVVIASIAMIMMVLPGGVSPRLDVFLGAALGTALVFGAAWAARNVDWPETFASVRAATRQMLQRQSVPVNAETADDTRRYRRDHGVVPEFLPSVNVRDVHFDQRGGEQGTGVAQRVGVVGPGPGVEHNGSVLVRRRVQPAEHLGLGVGLADFDRETELLADPDTEVGELGVGREAVDVRLPGAEAAKIRPVEYVHLHDETSW